MKSGKGAMLASCSDWSHDGEAENSRYSVMADANANLRIDYRKN